MLTEQLKGRQLAQKIKQIQQAIARIKQICSQLRYQSNERINRTALLKVQIKHTNQFTIDLGCDYLAQMRAEEAIKVMEFRLKYYNQRLGKQSQQKPIESYQKSGATLGKQNTVKLEGTHTGFLQCIGEENGQSIFNIVEMEGQEEQQPSQAQKNDGQLQKNTLNMNKNQQKGFSQQTSQRQGDSLSIVKPENSIPEIQPKTQSEKSSLSQCSSQKLDEFESDQGQNQQQYDDIIMNYRAKLGIVPESSSSTKEKILITQVPQEQKEKKQIKEQPKKAVKIVQPEQEIPQKVSRFKLQRMKQRLQQQL